MRRKKTTDQYAEESVFFLFFFLFSFDLKGAREDVTIDRVSGLCGILIALEAK